MTTYFTAERTCAVCGKTHKYRELSSTNSFGPMDLDMRPAPMQRWTMDSWVHTCPDCGYTAASVDEETGVDEAWLKNEDYISCEGNHFISSLAAAFYRRHMIAIHDNKTETAITALQRAAWACDDQNDDDMAKMCRRKAAGLLETLLKQQPHEDDYLVLLADLLRRSGQFDELLGKFENIHSGNDFLEKILTFEKQCAMTKDSRCYTVADVDKAG